MDQSDTPPPGLENLMRQQTSVTLKRVRGLGVLFVAVGRLNSNATYQGGEFLHARLLVATSGGGLY